MTPEQEDIRLFGANLDWCCNFESKVETLHVLNIIGGALTEKGRKAKKDLEQWINDNADKYFQLTN